MRKCGSLSLKSTLLGSAALVATVLSSSGAMAQNCVSTPLRGGFLEIGGLAAGTASSVIGAIGNLNTAFLSQQSSAFVAAPSGVAPDTQGGGVWVRGITGEVDIDSSTATAAQVTPILNPAIDSGTINCDSTQRLTFSGVQIGRDISRLNLMGYNVHVGATAGYLESDAKEQQGTGNFETSFEVPFAGIYGVLTKDAFFADANLRFEYYNINLNEPALSLFNQPVNASGVSLALGAGYHGRIGDGWFIEPSAGATLSRTTVDNFSAVGLPPGQLGNGLSGTFTIKPIKSAISRMTLRVGRSFTTGNLALQPFATASLLREWAGDVKSVYITCPNCVFQPGFGPVTDTFNSSTSRVGTWGQYSLGIAGQLINTGWLGFVRGDYRNGENLDGWTLNAGLRYQYTPEPQPVAFSKGPTVAMAAPVYWTGFYLGGNFGAAYGEADVGFTDFSSVDSSVAGWLGGGQVGYNYQFGAYVLGIEGDFGAANITGSETCGSANGLAANGVPVGFSPFFMTCGGELDWIATAAARFGVTWDRALFYVKAGAAWAEETVMVDCIIGPFNSANFRQCNNPAGAQIDHLEVSDTRTGWMVGYGSEFSLTSNWSAKAEFKYMDFGSQDYTASDGSRLTSDLQVSTVTVGINYRFSPAAAPLVARY